MYQIIQTPFTLQFCEMSKKELRDYNEWFHRIMPDRIEILASEIKSTSSYEKWKPDFSPDSLELVGEWFLAHVETRPRTQTEINNIQSRSSFSINVPEEELTNQTFSLAMDIGMYLSQVILKNHPSLRWSQPFGNKKSVDYGQPVLIDFGGMAFNPVHLMVTLAYGFSRKSKTGRRLRELYDYWSKQVSKWGNERRRNAGQKLTETL